MQVVLRSKVASHHGRGHRWSARIFIYFFEKNESVSEDCKTCNENIHLVSFLSPCFLLTDTVQTLDLHQVEYSKCDTRACVRLHILLISIVRCLPLAECCLFCPVLSKVSKEV